MHDAVIRTEARTLHYYQLYNQKLSVCFRLLTTSVIPPSWHSTRTTCVLAQVALCREHFGHSANLRRPEPGRKNPQWKVPLHPRKRPLLHSTQSARATAGTGKGVLARGVLEVTGTRHSGQRGGNTITGRDGRGTGRAAFRATRDRKSVV